MMLFDIRCTHLNFDKLLLTHNSSGSCFEFILSLDVSTKFAPVMQSMLSALISV